MPELKIHTPEGTLTKRFDGEVLLYELLADMPDSPGRPCGGGGSCGGCRVAAQGALSEAPDADGYVLACCTRATGDCEVWLPKRQTMAQIETGTPEMLHALEPMAGEYGSAVDLGTTTIVLRLFSLKDGRELATVSCENPQRAVAADVIGRIESALKGRLPMLRAMVRGAVDQLEQKAFQLAGIGARADVRVVAGNTTMLYLYTGRNPETLSHAPFEADCLFGMREKNEWLPACAGAFVGADITCAVLAGGMMQSDATTMLVDIGTNGEIVLRHNGKLYCCATAAGPAFEGGGISCGTGSIPGAVDTVRAQAGKLEYTTIGGAEAGGVCGSGLIDLLAALLDLEWMDETGALDDDVEVAPGVTITQKDIRQVQLAKGAIAAGMQVLMARAGIGCGDVKKLYIAGGFGSHLNLNSAARIGLIPPQLAGKAVVLGNASLGGAQRLLLDKQAWETACAIAGEAQCLNLAEEADFTDAFMECMMFE